MQPSFLDQVIAALTAAGPVEQIKLAISLLGLLSLIGIIAALISMRVSVCNQIYSRWQALLFKFGDTAGAYTTLATTTYNPAASTRSAGHYIAVGYLNLFEEAFHYHNARVLFVWRLLPNAFWRSIESSMWKQFRQFPYLKTFWEAEKSSFSGNFNKFIEQRMI